ncbi:MAG TPA: hypothetical protein VKD90_24510, partial [Gemmataceae bacterium]|nr:hypothetical protein [Gemmataceae bacterium]
MWVRIFTLGCLSALLASASGCAIGGHHACTAPPEITAVSLNPQDGPQFGKEVGVPFYLPKPLLIISKNFRHIETPTVGLTDSAPIPGGFDDQSKYADLNARTNFAGLNAAGTPATEVAHPASTSTGIKSGPTLHTAGGAPVVPFTAPSDGLTPETFYTYQIIFVPDMSQKYGLKVRGGPGEIRAAMNLVNGWQFTGIGPFYMKDSATAQNILASGISARLGGQAAADLVNAAANLGKVLGTLQRGVVDEKGVTRVFEELADLKAAAGLKVEQIANFAEIFVYEPHLTPDGRMEWCQIAQHQLNRQWMAPKQKITREIAAREDSTKPAGLQSAVVLGPSDDVTRMAVAGAFGLPANSPAITTLPVTGLQAGTPATVPAGGVNQIQVDVAPNGGGVTKEFNLIKFGDKRPRPVIQNRS